MDDIANRRRHKRTILQTDDELCAARLPRSPLQGHLHGGLRQRRTTVGKGNGRLTVKPDMMLVLMMALTRKLVRMLMAGLMVEMAWVFVFGLLSMVGAAN